MKDKIKKYLYLTGILFLTAVPAMAMASRPSADPSQPPPPAWITWAPMIFMLFIFYFLLLRPQSKQKQEKQKMLDNLKRGDRIITQGGFLVTVVNTGPVFLDVKLNEETKAKIQRASVIEVLKDEETVVQQPKLESILK